MLDAGASVGFFSVYAASICKKVIAVEPGWQSYRALSINRTMNKAGNIIPIAKALWSDPGYVRMIDDGTVRRVVASSIEDNQQEVHGQYVPCTTIDEILRELDCKVDVVKMDIEGAERECLNGEYLRYVREIVIETHDTKDYVLSVLREHGFSTRFIRFTSQHLLGNILKHPLAFANAALSTSFVEKRSSITSTIRQQVILSQMQNEEVSLIYGRKRERPTPIETGHSEVMSRCRDLELKLGR